MADIAGVVLGGIPIVIWAVDKYRDPMRTFFKYDTVLETFKFNLELQKEQLHATLRVIGVNSIPPAPGELEDRLQCMSQTQQTLFTYIIGEMNNIIEGLQDKLRIDTRGRPKWTTDPPERAKWEWARIKRSLRSKDRKEAIEGLQQWNTALKNCFERQELPFEQSATRKIAAIQKNFSLEHCNITRNRAAAIYRVLEKHWKCSCQTSHQATMDLSWHCDDATHPSQHFKMSLSYAPKGSQANTSTYSTRWHTVDTWVEEEETPLPETSSNSSSSTSGSRVTFQSSSQTRPGPLRPAGLLQKPLALKSMPPNPSTIKPVKTKAIAINLCSDFQMCKEADRFEKTLLDNDLSSRRKVRLSVTRSALASSLELIPMRSLLESRQLNRQFELSLKQRLCMAAAMSWGVLHLGDSPWMTSTWQREGLQFFLESSSDSTRFPDAIPCISSPLYKEDATHAARHQYPLKSLLCYDNIRNKTLFALGVYMIELGLDRPFAELREEFAKKSTDTPMSVVDDYDLTIKLADKLYFQIGTEYGDATMRCLRCEFPGRDVTKNFGFESFKKDFFNGVVAPVQATFDSFKFHKFG